MYHSINQSFPTVNTFRSHLANYFCRAASLRLYNKAVNIHSDSEKATLIGQRVTRRREASGLKKSQLAMYAGVSRAYITRLEQGKYPRSSATHLESVARVLNCTVQDLLGADVPGATDSIVVPREKAPAIRRLLDLDIGPQQLWDAIEGLARIFVRSGDDPHQHILGGHAGTERDAEGQQQTQPTDSNGAALC